MPAQAPRCINDGDMKTGMARALEWDYTELAAAYVNRPDYARAAIDRIAGLTGLAAGARALDLGAGAGHLTLELAAHGWDVLALEPNAAMRARGMARTAQLPNVRWIDGVMERTEQPTGGFSLCTCGSSFGVADRLLTLREVARVLADGGWFACLFNHRVLDDPLQQEIESYIRSCIPAYDYGTRREEQGRVIASSGLFEPAVKIEAPVEHVRAAGEWIDAWRSHATLRRQAGERFDEIVRGIAAIVGRTGREQVVVPYVTRCWLARVRRGGADPAR
jgi:ubiquinone/menaquinone biosynthesis C-methylase UbiE